MSKPALMRSFITSDNKNKIFEVYLKNGKKLTGKVTSIEGNTFIIECEEQGETLRSLVYFSKVSSVTSQKEKPAHLKGKSFKVDDNIGNRAEETSSKSGNVKVTVKRARFLGRKPVATPSDIEQERFYGSLHAHSNN